MKGGEEEIKIKKFLAGLGILSLVLALAAPVLAATEGAVTATVTPGIISVSIDTANIGYGTVNIPSVDLIPTGDPIIGATNNGGIPEDFTIRGDDATGTTKIWMITTGSPGGATTYDYNHKFIDCGNSSTCVTPAAADTMNTTPEALATGVAKDDTEYFKLRLSTPTETGGDLSEHSTSVTVTASAT